MENLWEICCYGKNTNQEGAAMAEKDESQAVSGGAGYKRKGQKYKSLLVWQVLLKRTDEEHPLSVDDIQDHLRMYGVETSIAPSIYRDIKDLKALLETNYNADI